MENNGHDPKYDGPIEPEKKQDYEYLSKLSNAQIKKLGILSWYNKMKQEIKKSYGVTPEAKKLSDSAYKRKYRLEQEQEEIEANQTPTAKVHWTVIVGYEDLKGLSELAVAVLRVHLSNVMLRAFRDCGRARGRLLRLKLTDGSCTP